MAQVVKTPKIYFKMLNNPSLLKVEKIFYHYYINMLISFQSDLKKLFRLSLIIDLVNDSIGSNECRDSTSKHTNFK